jgi:hypothetical protein
MEATNSGPVQFLNLEYWFRQLYYLFFGGHNVSLTGLQAFFAHVWALVALIGTAIAIISLAVIAYCVVRLFELRHEEEATLGPVPELAKDEGENPRWMHIQSLMAGDQPSQWREAIIEADILLEDILRRQGHTGAGVGEMLKQANTANFVTLDNAWEAHKVRNDIAHRGSELELSETNARRAIAKYETVFREFQAI